MNNENCFVSPFIAIHTEPTVTRKGFVCKKWRQFRVVVGFRPYGPRGGTCGNWINGQSIGLFKTYAEAVQFTASEADKHGYLIFNASLLYAVN